MFTDFFTYQIEVEEKDGKATAILWEQVKTPASMATHPGFIACEPMKKTGMKKAVVNLYHAN